jgi:rubrerythrin
MRARLNRNPTEARRRGSKLRRPYLPRRDKTTTVAEPAEPVEDDLSDERRLRESGGPDDRAMYTCSCGYVFEASVSTSVLCPHCGAPQAW